VAEEYSDNFFQTSSHSEENFRSTLGPGFVLLLRGARTFGAVSTTLDLVHDTAPNSGDEVKFFPTVNAAIRYALTPRLSLTLTDLFVRNDSATSTLDTAGIRVGRQTFDTNTAGATVDYLFNQVALQGYYRNVLFFNEGNSQTANGTNTITSSTTGSSQQNSDTNIVGVNATTRIATDYLVRGGYEFSATNAFNVNSSQGTTSGNNTSHTGFASFSRLFGLYASGGVTTSFQYQTLDDTKIYTAALFGAYGLPTGLSLSALLGYSVLNSDTQDNTGTITANANVSYRFARAVAAVGVSQGFEQTAQTGQNFGTVETRTYYGSFLYQITPFINTTLNASYSENEPTGTGNVQGAGTQTQLVYGGAVNWQLLRWLVARVQFTHIKTTGLSAFGQTTTSTNPGTPGLGGSYSENRALLTLFATF